jgi:two-component system sensor histidine kinase ChvG
VSRLAAVLGAARAALSRLGLRLLAFNLLLVFLPVGALLSLGIFEQKLLAAQERAMAQQGRVLAAALSESGPLVPEAAQLLLRQLEQRTTARLRILDGDGQTLADSARLGPRQPAAPGAPPRPWWQDAVAVVLRPLRHLLDAPPRLGAPPDAPEAMPTAEVRAALDGRYGSATRVDAARRTVVLSSALPVESGGRVVGVVLVTQSTVRLQQDLRSIRGGILLIFVASLVVASALSLWNGATLVRPLRRLRREAAALLERRGREPLAETGRGDEIGDLARTLAQLAERLEQQLRFATTVVADVSHEFKNPLASIRGAAEMLAEVDDPAERRRFAALLQGEIARLEKLLADVRDVTRIDQRIAEEARAPVDLRALLEGLVAAYARRAPGRVTLGVSPEGASPRVLATADRLAQAFENLIDNALSLAPEATPVEITLAVEDEVAVVAVRDRGPGIPAQHIERIFDRFFSYRPGAPAEAAGTVERAAPHSGLGLAIVRGIVQAYGGTVAARNTDPGAVFEVRLPLARLSGLALARG